MPIPIDAIPLVNFERMEKGLPPIPEPKIIREDPKPPKVDGQISLDQIDFTKKPRILRVAKKNYRNDEGIVFIGYLIEIKYLKDDSSIQGWLPESDFNRLIGMREIKEYTQEEILRFL